MKLREHSTIKCSLYFLFCFVPKNFIISSVDELFYHYCIWKFIYFAIRLYDSFHVQNSELKVLLKIFWRYCSNVFFSPLFLEINELFVLLHLIYVIILSFQGFPFICIFQQYNVCGQVAVLFYHFWNSLSFSNVWFISLK
jgi:hypothetical protein